MSEPNEVPLRRSERIAALKARNQTTFSNIYGVAGPSGAARKAKVSSKNTIRAKPKPDDKTGATKKVKKPDVSIPTTVAEDASNKNGTEKDTAKDEPVVECSICLEPMLGQEIGGPNSCQHIFCKTCITGWSKRCQKCPFDRKSFTHIEVRTRSVHGGNVSIKVEKLDN